MNGKVLSGPAAVLLIAFFFFPWVMVSCGGMSVEFSGYQLAAGVPPESASQFLSAQDMAAELLLFAIPLAGVTALVLLGVTLWRTEFEQTAAWGQIVASATAVLILFLEWQQWQQNVDPMLEISFRPALWGSFIMLLAILAGAVLDLILWRRTRPSAPSTLSAHSPKQSFPDYPPPASSSPAPETAAPAPYASSETITDGRDFGPPHVSQPTIIGEEPPDFPGQEPPISIKTELLQPEAAARLIIDSGDHKGKQFTLYGSAAIGRVAGNDIVIDDAAMSSYHARIIEENGRFTIFDQNSTNGVYIMNATQLRWQQHSQYPLKNGDLIKLGRTILQFTT
jgi:hypothetical protein